MTKPTRGPAPPPAAPGRRRSPSKRAPEIAATTPGAGPQTLRKQARAVLLKAGALQSAIFNSANFSSIATDAKGVIQIF
ncbi:MAG: hypothetical protein JNK56_08345, partial [Myxococcales bacterium]|nr:hypothetical protein [Myxococcales bacterium]